MIKPLLQAKFNNSWPDPKDYKTPEQFLYGYTPMWGWAKAGQEIIELIESFEERFEALKNKQEGKTSNPFRIGANKVKEVLDNASKNSQE